MAQIQDQAVLLKEWAPLTNLLNKLPSKTIGLFPQEIKLTCINVLSEFLALGTNVGMVYWYDRKRKDLQKLRCENANVPITFVKLVSTVDYMVACGNNIGNISVFQIPKSHPESLPENLKPKQKQVERYTVTDLHKSPITAIEWSKNGMKLFSGDMSGSIVLTEIDFYMHICKSIEILNESYEVVQLSYNQQRLLVSTTFRSIICEKLDKWKVCQVGKKDRKNLGKFGGLLYQNGFKISDTILYCTRPGLRMWISDIDGNVKKTLLFKDLLCKECPQVPLLNPISKALQLLKPQQENSFGILLPFCESLLVTYSNDIIYILNPEEMAILATITHLRSILNVATYKDEIFILEEGRSLLRISFRPEVDYISSVTAAGSNNTSLAATTFKDISIKLQSTTLFRNHSLTQNTFKDNDNDESIILNAEEAQESPIFHSNYSEAFKKFDDIGKQEFEDKILFKKGKKVKKKCSSNVTESTASLSSNSSEEKDLSYTRPTIMNLSAVGVLPDLRSPESIINDIEYKEKLLADVLNLDKVNILANSQPDAINLNKDEPKINETFIHELKDNEKETIQDINYISTENNISKYDNKNDIINNIPVFSIPNEWKLANVQIHKSERKTSVSTNDSLSDWEIV